MTTAYLMCGPMGSGKSYIASRFRQLDLPIFNPDDQSGIFSRNTAHDAWDAIHRSIKNCLDIPMSFILDSSLALEISRRRITQFIRQVNPNCHIICIFVTAPFQQCVKRNRSRKRNVPINTLREYYDNVMNNPPSRSDGFDEIIVVDNSEYPGNNDKLWTTSEPWPQDWYRDYHAKS